MKRIAAALLSLLLAGSVWADISAKLYLSGSLDNDAGQGLILNNQDQEYVSPGMLHVSADGKNAGFGFNLYTGSLSDASSVRLQKLSAWFRAFPTLKVSLGGVGLYTYTEQLNWWKDPNAATLASAGFDNNVGSDSSPAVAAEWTGLPALTLSAIAAPGYGTGLLVGKGANMKLGGAAKLDLKSYGSVAAGLRFDGRGGPAIAHVGTDLTAVPNLYTFVNAVIRNDNTDYFGLDAVAVDWYGKLTLQQLVLQAALPVTFRLTGLAGDVNYLSYNLKVSYDLPAVKLTPFVQAQQDHLNLSTQNWQPQVNLGTAFNGLDNASLDLSFQYQFSTTGSGAWLIPFNLNVWY